MQRYLAAAACALALVAGGAGAADYPTRPVIIVQPFPAGSVTDVFTRLLADGLRREFGGRAFVVEPKPGGGMAVAAGFAARAPKDGYTLLLAPAASVTLNELVNPNLPYRSADLAPIALLAVVPQVLTVRGALPIRSLEELSAYAKARPGTTTLGNGGVNTLTEIAAKLFAEDVGASFNHIPYNGSSAVRAAMLANQIDAGMDVIGGLPEFARDGKLIPIALLARKRHPALPEVKTFLELGFQRMDKEGWYGLMAPVGTPREVIDLLNAACARVLKSASVVERITSLGLQERYGPTEEFADVIAKDMKAWQSFLAANPIAK
jgi:tripartite-type tricarboxylate transporter receptor subunit TctC